MADFVSHVFDWALPAPPSLPSVTLVPTLPSSSTPPTTTASTSARALDRAQFAEAFFPALWGAISLSQRLSQRWVELSLKFVAADQDLDNQLDSAELHLLVNEHALPSALLTSPGIYDLNADHLVDIDELFFGLRLFTGDFSAPPPWPCTVPADCPNVTAHGAAGGCSAAAQCHSGRCFAQPPAEAGDLCVLAASGNLGTCSSAGLCQPTKCDAPCQPSPCAEAVCLRNSCRSVARPYAMPCRGQVGMCGVDGQCMADTTPTPLPSSPPPVCDVAACLLLVDNNVCDPQCNFQLCGWDGMDCQPPLTCDADAYCAPRFADGHCDTLCNNLGCLRDGGDCAPPPPPAPLLKAILYVLGSPAAVAAQAKQLKRGLEAMLYAPVTIHLPQATIQGNRRARRDGGDDSESLVAIMSVQADVSSECFDRDQAACFPSTNDIVSFLTAQAGSPRLAQQLGVQMVGAAAAVSPDDPSASSQWWTATRIGIVAGVGFLVLLAIMALVKRLVREDRKRKRSVVIDLRDVPLHERSSLSRTPADGAEPAPSPCVLDFPDHLDGTDLNDDDALRTRKKPRLSIWSNQVAPAPLDCDVRQAWQHLTRMMPVLDDLGNPDDAVTAFVPPLPLAEFQLPGAASLPDLRAGCASVTIGCVPNSPPQMVVAPPAVVRSPAAVPSLAPSSPGQPTDILESTASWLSTPPHSVDTLPMVPSQELALGESAMSDTLALGSWPPSSPEPNADEFFDPDLLLPMPPPEPAPRPPHVDALQMFFAAASTGHLATVQTYMPPSVGARNHAGDTALHVACRRAQHAVIKFLLDHDAPLDVRNSLGSTPLHEAVQAGDYPGTLLLLRRGASPNLPCFMGLTPLMSAIIHQKHICLAPLITAGADVSVTDKNGWAAVHWAAALNDVVALELLLQHRANINAETSRCETPLFIATKENNEQFVYALLKHSAKRSVEDAMGRTALDVARQHNFANVVVLLQDWSLAEQPAVIRRKRNALAKPRPLSLPDYSKLLDSFPRPSGQLPPLQHKPASRLQMSAAAATEPDPADHLSSLSSPDTADDSTTASLIVPSVPSPPTHLPPLVVT